MSFSTAATLLDTCEAFGTDTPTKAAGCRFIGQSEPGVSAAVNRALVALAENDEYLVANMTHKSWVVCDVAGAASGNDQDCDYAGATAIQDALDALGDNTMLFVRSGTYTLFEQGSSNELDITQDHVRIVGVGHGVVFEIGTGDNLECTGDNIAIENVSFDWVGGTSVVRALGSYFRMSDCDLNLVYLFLGGDNLTVERTHITNDSYCLRIDGSWIEVTNCHFEGTRTATGIGEPVVGIYDSHHVTVKDCKVVPTSPTTATQVGLSVIDLTYDITFLNCHFQGGLNPAFTYGSDHATNLTSASFIGCTFQNTPAKATELEYGPVMPNTVNTFQLVQLSFSDCRIETLGSTWYAGPFCQLIAEEPLEVGYEHQKVASYITLNNVWFEDHWAKGYDGTDDPPADASGASVVSVLNLYGVSGRAVTFEREPDYNTQNCASWLDMKRCTLADLRVNYDVGTEPCDSNVSVDDEKGLIFVGPRCSIRELRVTGDLGKGSGISEAWIRPLLTIKASISRQATALVDGFIIEQTEISSGDPNPTDWEFDTTTGPIFIEYGELRRFHWETFAGTDRRNNLSSNSTRQLVKMSDGGRLLDSAIRHNDDGNLLSRFIALEGTNILVQGNTFVAGDPASGTFGLSRFIDEAAASSRVKILGNDLSATTSIPSQHYIEVDNTGIHKVVSNNTLSGSDGASTDFIDFGSGGSDDENICVGNTVVNVGAGTADVNPGTVIGYSTNLFG